MGELNGFSTVALFNSLSITLILPSSQDLLSWQREGVLDFYMSG
jgi:hypothetical protein